MVNFGKGFVIIVLVGIILEFILKVNEYVMLFFLVVIVCCFIFFINEVVRYWFEFNVIGIFVELIFVLLFNFFVLLYLMLYCVELVFGLIDKL